jgi:hypothetical protein
MSSQDEQALRQFILERFPEHLPELVISLKVGMRLLGSTVFAGFMSTWDAPHCEAELLLDHF